MRGSLLNRGLALLAIILMLNTAAVSAQISRPTETPTTEPDAPSQEPTEPAAVETVEPEEPAAEEDPGAPICTAFARDSVDDEEEAGLVGRRQYESPQFGYTVEWTRDWQLDEYYEAPVVSHPSIERDDLCLELDDRNLFAYFNVVGEALGRGGPDADLEEWTDEDYIAAHWPDLEAEVLIGDATRRSAQVVYLVADADGVEYYVTHVSIEQRDGSMVYITFVADVDSFEDAYALVSEDVLLDGKSMFRVLDWDEIEAEL